MRQLVSSSDRCSFTPQRILSGRDEADGAFRDRAEADSDEEESSEEESSEDDDDVAADPDNAALPESPYQANAPRKSSPPPSSAQPAASALAGSSKPARAKGGVSFGNSTSAPAAEALAGSDDDDSDLRASGPSNRDAGKAVKLKNLSVSQPMSRRERCVGARACPACSGVKLSKRSEAGWCRRQRNPRVHLVATRLHYGGIGAVSQSGNIVLCSAGACGALLVIRRHMSRAGSLMLRPAPPVGTVLLHTCCELLLTRSLREAAEKKAAAARYAALHAAGKVR